MKTIAILCILIGLTTSVFLPWAQSNLIGNKHEFISVYDRPTGWTSTSVALDAKNNPYRLRVRATILPDAKLPKTSISLVVSVSGPDGVVMSGELPITHDPGNSGPEQNKTVSTVSPTFAIVENGQYQISAELVEAFANNASSDPGFLKVEIAPISGVETADTRYQVPGAILVIGGIYLLSRSRRRNGSDDDGDSSKPRKSRVNWGRSTQRSK